MTSWFSLIIQSKHIFPGEYIYILEAHFSIIRNPTGFQVQLDTLCITIRILFFEYFIENLNVLKNIAHVVLNK